MMKKPNKKIAQWLHDQMEFSLKAADINENYSEMYHDAWEKYNKTGVLSRDVSDELPESLKKLRKN